MSSAAVAGVRADFRFVERHFPNLVRARHGDVQVLVVNPQVPGAVQSRLQRLADKPLGEPAG